MILTKVFHRDRITIDAYRSLIQSQKMLVPFTLQKGAILSIHVYSIIVALDGHIPAHHIGACWQKTAHALQDTAFYYSALTQHLIYFDTFWSVIDNRARFFQNNMKTTSDFQLLGFFSILFFLSDTFCTFPSSLFYPRSLPVH